MITACTLILLTASYAVGAFSGDSDWVEVYKNDDHLSARDTKDGPTVMFVNRTAIHLVDGYPVTSLRYGFGSLNTLNDPSNDTAEYTFDCKQNTIYLRSSGWHSASVNIASQRALEFVCANLDRAIAESNTKAKRSAPARVARASPGASGGGHTGAPPYAPGGETPAKEFFANSHDAEQHGREKPDKDVLVGSGFAVSSSGHFLTNYHVVAKCSAISVQTEKKRFIATLLGVDKEYDLALLKVSFNSEHFAYIRAAPPVKQGESVMTVGYPYLGLLASGPSVSTGIVNALAGLGNDLSRLQISAPLQPGNSGGPVLDASGNVVGVAVEKLDAMKVAKLTGDIPQNVNFAVKASVALEFAKRFGVAIATATSSTQLDPVGIADLAKAYVAIIECE